MAAKLVAEEGNLKGLILPLDNGDQWIIGRDPDACQLLIEDPVASRRHLICRNTPQGILVENLSTTNPVLVNREEIKGPRLLHHGDTVKIGSGVFRFYTESEAHLFQDTTADTETPSRESSSPLITSFISSDNEPIEKEPIIEEEAPEEELPKETIPEEDISEESIDEIVEELPSPLPPTADIFEDKIPDQQLSIFEEDTKAGQQVLAEIDFELMSTGRWLLKVVSGPNSGAEFSMQPGHSYIIGTDPNVADIVFHDTSVSRQHSKLTINDDSVITIEDLKSKNGTHVNGEAITDKQVLPQNTMVSLGTTSFVIFDREGEMQTIISPFLPSIVKVLQQKQKDEENSKKIDEITPVAKEALEKAAKEADLSMIKLHKEKSRMTLTAYILIAIVTGLFLVTGFGIVSLFQGAPIEIAVNGDTDKLISDALAPFPSVQYSYNKASGTLLMVGHVLTDNAKKQLMYNLQGLKFIKNIDDSGIVIDEYVWKSLNPVIAKNPAWRSISIQATSPGQFVISGYLKNRKELDGLMEYLSVNFDYTDLLQNNIIVEEDLIIRIESALQKQGIYNIKTEFNNGDLSLKGTVPDNKKEQFDFIINQIKSIPGIRHIQNFATEQQKEKSLIDITDRYEVSGITKSGGAVVSVFIDGRVLNKGDTLDGMRVTDLASDGVYLEKDGIRYKITLK